MKTPIFILSIILTLGFSACNNETDPDRPDILLKPVVRISYDKAADTVGDTTIQVGPARDYEQASPVVYKIQISSDADLKSLTVNTSSLNRSLANGILRTEPANAIDNNGLFTRPLRSVTLYYAYNVMPIDVAGTPISLSFNVLNNQDAETTKKITFTPILRGSTTGRLLQYWPKVSLITPDNYFDMPKNSVQDYLSYSVVSVPARLAFSYSADALNHLTNLSFFVLKDGTTIRLSSPTLAENYTSTYPKYAPFKTYAAQMTETLIKKVTKPGVDINGAPVVLSYKDDYLLTTHDNKLDSILTAAPLPTTKSDQLKVGDVYAFRTAKGVKGFFYVTSASSATVGQFGTIEFKYVAP